jgi:hypothetical protein
MTTQTIQIDIDHNSLGTTPAVAKQYDLQFTLVKLDGPAGGNPLIELTGTTQKLISFLTTHYCDADDVSLYLN